MNSPELNELLAAADWLLLGLEAFGVAPRVQRLRFAINAWDALQARQAVATPSDPPTPHQNVPSAIPSALYATAARQVLTPEAADRYCSGDMTATDDAGHDAIREQVVSNVRYEAENVPSAVVAPKRAIVDQFKSFNEAAFLISMIGTTGADDSGVYQRAQKWLKHNGFEHLT